MEKTNKYIINSFIFLIFTIFIIVISPTTMQNDTFWSIKVGERLLENGVFGIDNFSFHEGLYYIAHHFFTDIIIDIIYCLGNFEALYVFEVILAFFMAGALYLLNKEISNNKSISLIMLFLQLCIMRMYISVRAQMISYILFVIELLLLEKYKKECKRKYIVGLSVIPIMLANFHMGTVPFYFVILGVYLISVIRIKNPLFETIAKTDWQRIKQLIIVTIIGMVTVFINPYFIDGVIYPFKTFGNQFINSTIQEFQNYTISFDGGITYIYIVLIILILIIVRIKIKVGDLLLLFGTLFMSFLAIRYIGLFIICSSVILRYVKIIYETRNINREDKKAIEVSALVMLIIITFGLLINRIISDSNEYVSKKVYPVDAVEFLKNNTCDVAFVQCFGNFEVFCNGTPLVFKRSKAKELFAYHVRECQ